MRIGLVTPGFSADAADWCIPALRHLVRALASDDDVRVFAVRYPYRGGEYVIDHARVFAMGGAERRGVSIADLWRTTLQTIASEHRRERFDVLHAFWATESGLLAALAGRLLSVPTLVSLAGGELVNLPEIGYGDRRSAWERFKVSASLRLAARVTAGSHALFRVAAQHVASEKLYRAPLGVPLDLFSPAESAGHGLMHVATLTPVKDQATLLRAFAIVHQDCSELTLEIVGDGPLRRSLEMLTHDLGVSGAVRFVGDVDHACLPDRYRRARGFVLSSLHEAQGMAALEAAACGLSVAGTNVGVIPEITASNGVAPRGDAAALARAMHTVLANPYPADVADFSLETCTNRFRDLYAGRPGA